MTSSPSIQNASSPSSVLSGGAAMPLPVSATVVGGGLQHPAPGPGGRAAGAGAFVSSGGGAIVSGGGMMVMSGSGVVVSGGGTSDVHRRPTPQGTLAEDWPTLLRRLRQGELSTDAHYRWERTDPGVTTTAALDGPTGTDLEVDTLMGRAWSRTAAQARWDDVQPLIDEALEQGASLYLLKDPSDSNGWITTLDVMTDPAKLNAWLARGGDPSAPEPAVGHAPGWWTLMKQGAFDLLDELRTHPGWARWSRVQSATNDGHAGSVMRHWAIRNPGTPFRRHADHGDDPLGITLALFDWLVAHVPQPEDGPLDRQTTATLLKRALNRLERTKAEGPSSSPNANFEVRLWSAVIRGHTDRMDLAVLEQHVEQGLATLRSSRPIDPGILAQLRQPLERRWLVAAAQQVEESSSDRPVDRPRSRL